MENTVFKGYKLEEVLDLYINNNGISQLLNKQNGDNDVGINSKEIIDKQVEKDFLDDIDVSKNESEIAYYQRIKRYQKIVNMLKQKYGYKCQVCGFSFHMDNGNNYCEAHHIKMLSDDGSQTPNNVIILCANHHRMFHYASNTCIVGDLNQEKRIIRIGDEEFTVQY
jgi:predicted restriction endonuclease